MKERIITALCLIAIVVPAVIFGGIFYKIVIGVAMGLSVYEMLHICSRPRIGMYMYIIVGLFFVTGFLFNRNQLLISSYSILVYLAVILACMIFDDKCNIERSAYVFTMGVLVCSGLHALLVLRVDYGWEYLLLLAIATFGSDTGAYFAGMAFGKHKLIPRLSPKKTIEGSIGGIVGNDRDGKVYKLLHFAGEERDIADPWYTGNFDATYDDVLKGCTALLNEILDTEKFTKEN